MSARLSGATFDVHLGLLLLGSSSLFVSTGWLPMRQRPRRRLRGGRVWSERPRGATSLFVPGRVCERVEAAAWVRVSSCARSCACGFVRRAMAASPVDDGRLDGERFVVCLFGVLVGRPRSRCFV